MDTCQLKGYDVGFLFVVQSKNYIEFEQKLTIYQFAYQIIYDTRDEINKLNQFSKEERFRTFLLDNRNKVVLIGSPINNEKIRKLYFRVAKSVRTQS